MKILIVDDSRTSRLQIKKALESAGWEITEAESGAEALQILETSEKFDVMITDQNMPEMAGIDLVKNLRGDSANENNNIKVIFMTSDSSSAIKEAAFNLQASAFILKPVNPSALVKVVSRVVGNDDNDDD